MSLAAMWVAPLLALAGVLGMIVPLVIHWLGRVRRPAVKWGAMRLLEKAWRQQRRRRQVEMWLLLVCRCLMVLVAGLALAGPLSPPWQWLMREAVDQQVPVQVVMDNGLTSMMLHGGDAEGTRLDALKDQLLAWADRQSPDQPVVLWELAHEKDRSKDAPLWSGTCAQLPVGLKQVVSRVQPINWDVLEALPHGPTMVLSDWARGQGLQDRAVWQRDGGGVGGGEAPVVLSIPMASRENWQLAALEPGVFPMGSDQRHWPMRVQVRRWGQPADVRIALVLQDENGEVLSDVQYTEVQFAPGSDRVWQTCQLVVPEGVSGRVQLVATLETAHGEALDELVVDNRQQAVRTLPEQWRVAIVGHQDQLGTLAFQAALDPQALLPGRVAARPFAVQIVSPQALDQALLETVDVVVLQTPEALNNWLTLADWVRAGGGLWVLPTQIETASSDDTLTETAWSRQALDALGLDWRQSQGVDLQAPMALQPRALPPLLEGLTGRWTELQNAVRVSRLRSLQAALTADQIWLSLDTHPTSPVLVETAVGAGRVLWQTVTFSEAESTLAVQPLMVPLARQGVCVLASGHHAGGGTTLPSGDAHALSREAVAACFEGQTVQWLAGDGFVEAVAASASKEQEGRWTWPLLWLLLILVLVELILARSFALQRQDKNRFWSRLRAAWIGRAP